MRKSRRLSVALLIATALGCLAVGSLGACAGLAPPDGSRHGVAYDTESTAGPQEGEALARSGISQTEASGGASEDFAVSGGTETRDVDEKTLLSWLVPSAYAQDHQVDERYLIRTGECRMNVSDYDTAESQVTDIALRHGGMVTDSHSEKRGEECLAGWITLRVPTENFFQVWTEILKVGEVRDRTVSTDDVSQEYVGYVSRLKSLMAEQAVLQQMLDEALAVQRSRGLGEGYSILLDTQERLFAVTGKIEAMEDRLNALSDRITRSTITVQLTEEKLPAQVAETFTWGFGTTAGAAYKDLLVKVRGIGQGLIYFLITCWTWVIPLALIGWGSIRAYKRWLAPKVEGAPSSATK